MKPEKIYHKVCDTCGTRYGARAPGKRNCPMIDCSGNLRVIKISPAQRKVLESLRDGWVLHWLPGLYPSAFLTIEDGPMITVSIATYYHLETSGYLEIVPRKYESHGSTYTISEKGREAISNTGVKIK